METLKIEIPKGYVIDKFDLAKGEIKFKEKPKDVTLRIKSVYDAITELVEDDPEVIIYNNLLLTFDTDCHVVKQQEAVVLTKAFNEGWTPNWNNSNEVKYYPWFEMGGSSVFRFSGCVDRYSLSDVGSRLCFKTRELAIHAGENFTAVYKKFMLID